MILFLGSLLNDSSLVATLATLGYFFIGKNSRWPPNDVIIFLTFIFFIKHGVWYMLSGVLGVKESMSVDILSIWFHLSHYSEQEVQMDPYCSLKISNFHKNKMTLNVTDISNTSSTSHILDHFDSFGSHPVWKILTWGPIVPKLHTVAQKFIHVVSINGILSWVGGKEQSVFCCVVSFILLKCNFRDINYFYKWLPLFITVIPPWLQPNNAPYRGILSLSKKNRMCGTIRSVI